ncbi:hypothetical protein HY501_02760 [Candidatus Woesearchaeota archaeon]|nr:hypothetical protein [Candidatus Woesearchaeota archaeon]
MELNFRQRAAERNIDYLKNLRDHNELLDRVYSGETTLRQEADDLLYFFGSKSRILLPQLRPNHDERMEQLGHILNPMNLLEDEEAAPYLTIKYGGEPCSLDDIRKVLVYEWMKGEARHKSPCYRFSEKGLHKAMKMRRRVIEVPIALAAAGIWMLSEGYVPESIYYAIVAGVSLKLYTTYNGHLLSRYNALQEKSDRADKFIGQHIDQLR